MKIMKNFSSTSTTRQNSMPRSLLELWATISNSFKVGSEHFFRKFDFLTIFDQKSGATPVKEFPSIEGDFFSYADRTDNYWTGFFNSRPFYKWFDRWLEHWVQATDTLFSLGRLRGSIDQVMVFELLLCFMTS